MPKATGKRKAPAEEEDEDFTPRSPTSSPPAKRVSLAKIDAILARQETVTQQFMKTTVSDTVIF